MALSPDLSSPTPFPRVATSATLLLAFGSWVASFGCGIQCRMMQSDYEAARASKSTDSDVDSPAELALVLDDELVRRSAADAAAQRLRGTLRKGIEADVDAERPVAVGVDVDSVDAEAELVGDRDTPSLRLQVSTDGRAEVEIPELPTHEVPISVTWNDELPLRAIRLDENDADLLTAQVADADPPGPSTVDVDLEEMRDTWRHVLSAELGATVADRLSEPSEPLQLVRRQLPDVGDAISFEAPKLVATDGLDRLGVVTPTSAPSSDPVETARLVEAPDFGEGAHAASVAPSTFHRKLVRRALRTGDIPDRFGPGGAAVPDGPNRVTVDETEFWTPADADRSRLSTRVRGWHLPESLERCHSIPVDRTAVVDPGKRLSLEWKDVRLFEPHRDKPGLQISNWNDSPLYDHLARLALAGLRLDTLAVPETDVTTRGTTFEVGEKTVSTTANVTLDSTP